MKQTNTGANLSGWEIKLYSDAACSNLVGTYVTGADGKINTENLLPGTYYAKEVRTNSGYWVCDKEVKTATVTVGNTVTVTFTNTHYGELDIYKETNFVDPETKLLGDANGDGWVDGTDVALIRKYSSGAIEATDLDLSVCDVDGDGYVDVFDANLIEQHTTGAITLTRENRSGWVFNIYEDQNCTNIIETLVTDRWGTASTTLLPGTYYLKEQATADRFWICDDTVYEITITGGVSTRVKVFNQHMGEIQFSKETNTGANLSGWEIKLYSDAACSNLVGSYITGVDGIVTTELLQPGTYYAKETASDSPYWVSDAEVKTITVTAGSTSSATFANTHYGKIQFVVNTNTGADLSGWEIKLYGDAELTDLIGTYITGEDGTTDTEILLPGTYYAQQTAIQDPFWSCDTEVKTAIVVAGQTTKVVFNNIHYGNIHFNKTTNTGTDLSGWEIKLYGDAELTDLISTYITGEDGTVITENLLPGTYYAVETPSELIYWSSDAETKKIIVTAGSTQEVNFHNDLLAVTVTIDKVSPEGVKLAGAKFLLEWSVDGTNWTPVIFTDGDIPTIGCCTSAGLVDGCLISSKDADITFTGLYPTLMYRITEVAAPKGYLLLTDYAYNGTLPADTLDLTLTVVNNPEFPLPATGVTGSIAPFIGAALAVLTAAALAAMTTDKTKKR